jgi:hypothetical protein
LDASEVKIASLGRYIVENDFLGVKQSRTKRRSDAGDSENPEGVADLKQDSSTSSIPVSKRKKGVMEPEPMQVDAPSVILKPMSPSDTKMDMNEDDDDGLADLRAILDAHDDDLQDSSNDGEEDEEGEDGLPRRTYLRQYSGHVSSMTIKGRVEAAFRLPSGA